MKKVLLVLGVILILFVFIAVVGLSYLGVFPGLSKSFVKQKDLGINYEEEAVSVLYEEIGFDNDLFDLSTATSSELVYSGKTKVNREFTSEELSAMLSSWSNDYTYVPFRNVQVKISNDGTVEFSAVIMVENAVQLAGLLGYSDEQIDAAKKYVNFVSDEIPVYGKGVGGAIDNKVTVDASVLRVGNIQIPSVYVEEICGGIEDVIERRVNQISGLHVDELSFDNGEMTFGGTFPEKVSVEE